MLQDERINDSEQALRAILGGWQRKIWTSLPAIVDSFDPIKLTISAKPAIQMTQRMQDDSTIPLVPSLLVDVPVLMFGGGGFTVTLPLQRGDEVLILFSMRCINAWWQNGDVQQQEEWRIHDPSDAIAIPGLRSLSRKLTGVNASTMQIRSDDGLLYLELAAGHIANIVAPGGINITGNVNVTGTLKASGEITGNGIDTSQHVHSYKPGSGSNTNTGTPTG